MAAGSGKKRMLHTEKMRMHKTDRRNLLICYAVMSAFMVIPACFLHETVTVDELGTLANSALLAGYDWTDAIHSSGSFYYKYGSLVFYALPYLLVGDSVLLYRIILIIGALILSASAPIAYLLCRRHLGIEDPSEAVLISLCAAGAPSVLFQSTYARTDWVLAAIPWILMLLMAEAAVSEGSRKVLLSGLLGVISVYAYMCHTRGLVTVLALFLTILTVWFLYGRCMISFPAYVGVSLAGLLADRILTGYFRNRLWGAYAAEHGVAETFDFTALCQSLSLPGLKIWVKSLTGWFFSVGTSTFGLVWIGIFGAVLLVITAVRSRDLPPGKVLTAVFSLLQFGGSFLAGILFFYPVLSENYRYILKEAVHRTLYERYMTSGLGLVLLTGLAVWLRHPERKRRRIPFLVLLGMTGILLASGRVIFPLFDHYSFDRKMMAGVSWLMGRLPSYSGALCAAGITAIAAFGIFILLVHREKRRAALLLLFVLYAVVYLAGMGDIRMKKDRSVYSRMSPLYEVSRRMLPAAEQWPDVFVETGVPGGAKNVQTLLKEYHIFNEKVDGYQEKKNLLIVIKGKIKDPGIWGDDLYRLDEYPYRKSGVSLYIKGEELAEAVQDLGIGVTECFAQP